MRNEPPENKPDNLLPRAIASLRDRADAASAASPQPSAGTVNQTLAALSAARTNRQPHHFNWKSLMKRPAFQLSAAALFAIAVAGAIWTLPLKPTFAFADVIAKVASVKSVSFTGISTTTINGADHPTTSQILIAAPSRMRMVIEPGGSITIMDQQAGKWVMLDPKQKTAMIMSLSGKPPQAAADMNILEGLKNIDSKDFEKIGTRQIDGHATTGFRRKTTGPLIPTDETIWVDQKTELPLEIEMTINTGPSPSKMIARDFQWDVPVDDSLFNLTPPPDYKITTMAIDVTPPGEKDLIEALRTAAELHDNIFPDTFDSASVFKLVSVLTKQTDPTAAMAARDKLMPLLTKVVRGISFVSPKNGSDFHYAGKQVKLNEPNRPILWYLPATSTGTYRVINADLTIHDAKVAELPTVPSVLLGSAIAPASRNAR